MGPSDCPPRTPLSVGAGLASLVLALVLVSLLGAGVEATYLRVLLGALSVAILVLGGRLVVTNCPESRFGCSALGLAVGCGTLLAVTVGVPGASPVELGAAQWALLGLGPAVPVALRTDAHRQARRGRPYAH